MARFNCRNNNILTTSSLCNPGCILYTFRSWCEKHRSRESFHSPDRTSRFLMAGIAGIAIGAFNDLFPKEVLFSPLALAFIVGYAIDVFTSRLDVLIENLKKKPTPEGSAAKPTPEVPDNTTGEPARAWRDRPARSSPPPSRFAPMSAQTADTETLSH